MFDTTWEIQPTTVCCSFLSLFIKTKAVVCSLRALKWSMITRDSFDSKHHWMKERPQDFLRFTYSKWEEQPQCLAEMPKKSSLSEERPESRWRPGLISSQVSPHFHGSRKSCFNRKHSREHKGWKGQAPWLLLFFLTCLFLITLPLCETKPHLYNITARDGWEGRIWKGCGRDHSLCATWGAVLILSATVSALSNGRL